MLHLPKSARYAAGSRSAVPRLPAAAAVGLVIIAGLAVVIYWHLDSEYRALEQRFVELQEKFHIFIEKKEALQLQYKDLQKVGRDASRKIEESKERLAMCEKERETLETAIREKQQQIDSYAAKTAVLFNDRSTLGKREHNYFHLKDDTRTKKP